MRDAVRTRRVARCKGCGRVAAGVTTSRAHLRAWGQNVDDSHVCDECRAEIVERPLEAVLDDFDPAAPGS